MLNKRTLNAMVFYSVPNEGMFDMVMSENYDNKCELQI